MSLVDAESDEVLMGRVQVGDRRAYEVLYARWKDPIFSFLHRRTLSLPHAEEAHQETWLRVYRWRDRFDTSRPFRAWLYTLACHAASDAREPEPQGFQDAPVQASSVEDRDLVVQALHALDPLDRRLLLLVVEGFSAVEVAEMLEIGHAAARMRISRARRRVREVLHGT